MITFWIDGASLEDEESFIKLNNGNAAALLQWLGLNGVRGLLHARELANRCMDRLAQPSDADIAVVLAGCIVLSGRPLCYLRDRTHDLLTLATRASDGFVRWA